MDKTIEKRERLRTVLRTMESGRSLAACHRWRVVDAAAGMEAREETLEAVQKVVACADSNERIDRWSRERTARFSFVFPN